METEPNRSSWTAANLNSPWRTAILACFVFILSYYAAKLGEMLIIAPQADWPLWLGNVLLVSILLLVPRRMWPILIVAAFGASLLYNMQAGLTIRWSALLILSDTVEVLTAALCLSYAFGGVPRLNSVRALAKFSLFAVILAPFIGAFAVALATNRNYWASWRVAFFSEAIVYLTLMPAILGWFSKGPARSQKSRAYYLETAALIAGLVVFGYLTFVAHGRQNSQALLYSLVPFMIWAALRFGSTGVSTSAVAIAVLAIWGTTHGRGPFIESGPLNNVLSLQLFLFFAAAPFMVLAAVVEENKQASEQLFRSIFEIRDSEERHRVVVEAASDAVISMDENGAILLANAAALRVFGYEPTELIGKPLTLLMPEYMRKLYEKGFKGYLATGERHINWQGTELTGLRKNGQEFPVEISFGELVKDGRRIFTGFIRDISERKRAEEALRRSESYKAEAQRLSHTGSFGWNVSAGEIYWSAETFRIFGYQPTSKVTIEMVLQRTHPEDRLAVQQLIERVSRERTEWDFEHRLLMPDGSIKYLQVVGRPSAEEGSHFEFVGAVTDVSERKRADENRERLHRALADLARIGRVSTMGELTASLAHEIKQPIAAATTDAKTCLRWLNRDEPNVGEGREAASRLIKDVTRASDIISRIGSLFKKDVLRRELVDVNELIREMVVLLRSEAARYSISIHGDLASNLPQVMADRVQLQQVLMNLMLNGIEAMKDMGTPGKLTVKSEQDENRRIMVAVADTGVGLNPEQAEQIFNAFFTSKPQGTGMGLPISRSIVESHGGRLWATTHSGPGATFQFTLPIEATAHEAA